jgi:putative ABC transport system ATP-binding protein
MVPVVEARQLARTYRSGGVDVLALRGVDLVLERGEFVAVMGPSGCGKSTLLNLIGGLDRPTAGQVLLDGDRVDDRGEARLAVLRRQRIGFVFQAFNLLPSLTVAENVELPLRLTGSSASQARARRDKLLSAMSITARADSTAAQLSGGEQQRVAIARALANRPSVLLADEPTGNLDSVSARQVLALLRAASTEGQALLLVTHDARVAATADRVVTMRDGLVVDESELSSVRPLGPLLGLEDAT